MFEILNQPWFGSVLGLLGIISGIVGLLLYLRSKIGARPFSLMKSFRLIGNSEQALPPELEFRFKDKSIPRLTLTTLYLWNAGKQTLLGDQIVSSDPLCCEFESDDDILQAHVVATTRKVNKVSVTVPK